MMKTNYFCLYFIIFLGVQLFKCIHSGNIKFTNVKCEAPKPDVFHFYQCRLNAINRTRAAITIKGTLHEELHSNITISFKFMRRSNGYVPFMYDANIDGCKFMRTATANNEMKHPLLDFVYKMTSKYSNINHTCPYRNDIIVDGLYFEKTTVFGLPGEYGIFSSWSHARRVLANINVYFTMN